MAYASHSDFVARRERTHGAHRTVTVRQALILVLGALVMALSGGGLAGYLDIGSATAAPVSAISTVDAPAGG